jgi:hypothetical protein
MKIVTVFLVIAVFGIVLFSVTTSKKVSAANVANPMSDKIANEPRIDFILGSWIGTGFITDANGLQQYIEIQETNTKVSNNEYQIVGICKNPTNRFQYAYNKSLFFNTAMNVWFTKGTINGNLLPDSHTDLGNNNVLSYSYYDVNRVLVRHTTARDTDGGFTETQEKWGQNGWDKTAWFRMTKNLNTNTTFSSNKF